MWRRLARLVVTVLAAAAAAAGLCVREVADLRVDDRDLRPVSTRGDTVLTRDNVTAVFARRLAGAVWRLEYRGRVLVPELDGNGGSLQTAMAFDIPPGESAEVENPTEAGSVTDGFGRTSSVWRRAAASRTTFFSETDMAYWYPPGMRVASSPFDTRARGEGDVSDVRLTKRVKLGYRFPGVVNFKIRLRARGRHHFVQVQPLALYLARELDEAYVVRDDGSLDRVDLDGFAVSPPQTSRPFVLAARGVAVGLYVHTVPEGGRFRVGWQPWYTMSRDHGGHRLRDGELREVPLIGTGGVWHAGDQADRDARIDDTLHFGAAVVVGSGPEAVAKTMKRLSDSLC